MLPCRHLAALIAMYLVAGVACTQQSPPRASTLVPSDHVAPSPVGTTQTILQKTFNLKSSAVFPFEIPAHAMQPHLHGMFLSFVGQVHGTADETANISFLIMNEEQNAAFARDRPSEAVFSVEDSHNQAVNYDLPASMSKPVKYYLVFRNSEGSKSSKVVEADFRVDF